MRALPWMLCAIASGTIVSGASCASDDQGTQDTCGDGVCLNETASTCPADCVSGPICGDGACNGTETPSTCPGDCPLAGPRCGDGVCNGTETTASCPGDCPCTNNTNANDTCTGDTVCVSGRCVSAFGRVYKIRAYGGSVLEADAAGNAWDFPGGLPDVLANVEINSVSLGNTLAASDTLMPVWNTEYTATIPGGSTFVIRAYDEDTIDANDYMFGCQFQPLTAATIRAQYVTCSSFAADPAGLGSSMTFWFEAQ